MTVAIDMAPWKKAEPPRKERLNNYTLRERGGKHPHRLTTKKANMK